MDTNKMTGYPSIKNRWVKEYNIFGGKNNAQSV